MKLKSKKSTSLESFILLYFMDCRLYKIQILIVRSVKHQENEVKIMFRQRKALYLEFGER